MKPRVIVVMGVSGAGKSLIGSRLADRLGWNFADADDYHPDSNVRKMRDGQPLTDADRLPWLAAIHTLVSESRRPLVLACSALKAAYRETIRGNLPDVIFVYLTGSFDAIAGRLEQREGHYMPVSLLRSQFEALEPPVDALVLDCQQAPDELVARIISGFDLQATPG